MQASGADSQYRKPGLSPDSIMRWNAIANRLLSTGNQPSQAGAIANRMTREDIGRRLNIVKENSYIQPVE